MAKLLIRKKDQVIVISGKDKGKKGEIIQVFPDRMRVLVSKINMVTKHTKPRGNEPGGRQKIEAPIAYSNIMLLCTKCEQPMRPKKDKLKSGERVRICRKCGETLL